MIFVIMVGLLILLPLGLFYFAFVNKNYKRVGTYLGGANIDNVTFEGAMASTQTIELKNYYLEKYFGEDRLFNVGVLVSLTLTLRHVRGGIHMNSIYDVYQSLSMLERMLVFLVLAPFVGGFLAGIDRKLSARLQGRYGPPLRQPFFDVLKLFQKERIVVNKFQNFSIVLFFLFTVFSGALFFAGADLLLTIFSLALAGTFFVLGGFAVGSPYSHLGAEREMIQMVAYEPMVILMAVGMYQVTGSFKVADLVQYQQPLILYLPGIFAGFLVYPHHQVQKISL